MTTPDTRALFERMLAGEPVGDEVLAAVRDSHWARIDLQRMAAALPEGHALTDQAREVLGESVATSLYGDEPHHEKHGLALVRRFELGCPQLLLHALAARGHIREAARYGGNESLSHLLRSLESSSISGNHIRAVVRAIRDLPDRHLTRYWKPVFHTRFRL